MPVFLVVQTSGNQKDTSVRPLAERMLEEVRANQAFAISDTAWFIEREGNSRDVGDHLGITNGSSASAVVASVVGYSGFTNRYLWEWLRERPGRSE